MSARVGSTTDNSLGGWYSYRASKAAVNSLTKSFDIFVKGRSGENAMAMSYHPGTVKTGLSKEFWNKVAKEKLFDPEFAVEKMCHVAGSVGLKGRGKCWDWKGTEVLP
jgi:NAD(P)-dependent dehydrogenase (short-subunit alcohol dehydrogenase family)